MVIKPEHTESMEKKLSTKDKILSPCHNVCGIFEINVLQV